MHYMKIEHHLRKVERFTRTLRKLDYSDDYETMIEDFLLAAAHMINALLHRRGLLREDKDIKHNLLYGYLKDQQLLELADLIQQLEQLRPSHVYGKGENGNTARKAEEIFQRIKEVCI